MEVDGKALAAEFLRISRHELRQSLNKIEKAAGRLTPEQLWARSHENENAVGNLILHLAGNVRQWIVRGVGGAVGLRDRDAEFARREQIPLDDLLARLRAAVEEADKVLETLPAERLLKQLRIQNYEVTVLHAVCHVVEHFGQHTGQILWIVKNLSGEDLAFYAHLKKSGATPGGAGEP